MNYVLKVMIVTSHYGLKNTIHYMTSFGGQRNSIILYNKTRTTPNRYFHNEELIVGPGSNDILTMGQRYVDLGPTISRPWSNERLTMVQRLVSGMQNTNCIQENQ